MNNGEDNYELRENALWGLAGFDYQKLLAIDIALTFFEKTPDPDYFSIKMEADGIGALDDVVVSTKKSEPIYFYQVKHHYPGTKGKAYSFAALVNPEHKKRVCISQFFGSWYENIRNNKNYDNPVCVLFSNHEPLKNLKSCIDEKSSTFKANFIYGKGLNKQIIQYRTKIFSSIKKEFKNAQDKDIEDFLRAFQFQLSQPSKEEYVKKLCSRFKRIAKTEFDNDFRILQRHIDDNFFIDSPITPEFIKEIINSIHTEKIFSFFYYQAEVLFKSIRNKVGNVHIKVDVDQLKFKEVETLTLLYGESGAGKTALIKDALSSFKPFNYLYLNANEFDLCSTLISALLNDKSLSEKVKVIVVDNMNSDTDVILLKKIMVLYKKTKIIFSFQEKFFSFINSAICNICKDQDKKEDMIKIKLKLLTHSILDEKFKFISEKVPGQLKARLTPFIMDKLVSLAKENILLIKEKYELDIVVLDLWFSKIFSEEKSNVLQLLMKIALKNGDGYSNSDFFRKENRILSILYKYSIIYDDINKKIQFTHDSYSNYIIYKYFEKIYEVDFLIGGSINFFIDRCLVVTGSQLFFIKNFDDFSKIMPTVISKELEDYLHNTITEAIFYDNPYVVEWYFNNLKISPLCTISRVQKNIKYNTNYIMYAIELNAKNVLAKILAFVKEPLLKVRDVFVMDLEESENEEMRDSYSSEYDYSFRDINDSSDESEFDYTEEGCPDKYESVDKYFWNDNRIEQSIQSDTTESFGFRAWKVKRAHGCIERNHNALLDNTSFYVSRAVELSHLDIVKLLLNHNKRFDTTVADLPKNNYGETPLHLSALHSSFDYMRTFVSEEHINSTDRDKETPLHNAVYQKDFFKIFCLLMCGADPNILNIAELSPLHLAVLVNSNSVSVDANGKPKYPPKSIAIIALLRYFGADPSLTDNESNTPFDLISKVTNCDWEGPDFLINALDKHDPLDIIQYQVEDKDEDEEESEELESRSREEKFICTMALFLLEVDKNKLDKIIKTYLYLLESLEPQHSPKFREFIKNIFRSNDNNEFLKELSDKKIACILQQPKETTLLKYFSPNHTRYSFNEKKSTKSDIQEVSYASEPDGVNDEAECSSKYTS